MALMIRSILAATILFACIGCTQGQVGGTEALLQAAPSPTPTPVPTPTPAPNLNACQDRVLDYGQKGSVAAVTRGNTSDLKMIPGSAYPSVAYYDSGTLTLRFSAFNGSRYVTEIVAGESSANFIKLAYLSNGKPAIFWSTGNTTLKAAFRSAVPGSAGSWTAAVIDSSTASRALSVSINPLDEIAVLQLTNTANTGRARFLYCPAGCSTPFGFQTMTAGVQVESANIVPAQQVTDVAWCKVSASDYYPVVVYGGNSVTRYAVCRQSDLSQCLVEANWLKQNVIAGANVSASLAMDMSIVGDIPKVAVLKAGTGIKTYKMGTTACSAVPGAFTELTGTIGGTASGSTSLNFLKDSTGQFHIIANESTTSIRYYNNPSATDPLTNTWSAVGTLDTLTLPAGMVGGAATSSLDGKIYLSYGQAARGFNLVVGTIQDPTTSAPSATFNAQYVDNTGALQLVAAPLSNLSLHLDSQDRPGTAYVDFSPGAATGARLKYARRRSSSPTSAWDIVLIPGTTNPQFPEMAYDDQDRPWISYFDQTLNRFFLATNTDADGSGTWTILQFPVQPTGTYTLPATNSTALVMDRSTTPYRPVMLVLDSTNTAQGLKVARFNPATASWSTVTTLDALGTSDATALTADDDENGQIVVTFYDLTLTRLRYVASADGGVTWSSPLSISSVGQGAGATVKLNPANGAPGVSFYDRVSNKVLFMECADTAVNCASLSWSQTELDSSVGTSTLTNSASNAQDQLLSAALSFFTDGTPFVSYTRTGAAGGQLLVSERAGSSFVTSTLRNGVNAGLSGVAPYNHGVGGWNTKTAISRNGILEAVSIGPGNWLYSTTCGP